MTDERIEAALGDNGETIIVSGQPMSKAELVGFAQMMARVSWQACPSCGGVFVVWRDPQAPPIHEIGGSVIEAAWFAYRDGSPCEDGTVIHCSDCGSTDYHALVPIHRRWGPSLPPAPPLPEPLQGKDEARE